MQIAISTSEQEFLQREIFNFIDLTFQDKDKIPENAKDLRLALNLLKKISNENTRIDEILVSTIIRDNFNRLDQIMNARLDKFTKPKSENPVVQK